MLSLKSQIDGNYVWLPLCGPSVCEAVPVPSSISLAGMLSAWFQTSTLLCTSGVKWNWQQFAFKCTSVCQWKAFFSVSYFIAVSFLLFLMGMLL